MENVDSHLVNANCKRISRLGVFTYDGNRNCCCVLPSTEDYSSVVIRLMGKRDMPLNYAKWRGLLKAQCYNTMAIGVCSLTFSCSSCRRFVNAASLLR